MLQTKLIAAALAVASCAWAGTVYTSESAFAASVGTTTTNSAGLATCAYTATLVFQSDKTVPQAVSVPVVFLVGN
jgi:hypothetical protein